MHVEHGTGKVRRPETDVLPLSHATNIRRKVPDRIWCESADSQRRTAPYRAATHRIGCERTFNQSGGKTPGAGWARFSTAGRRRGRLRLDERVVGAAGTGLRRRRGFVLLSAVQTDKRSILVELGQLRVLVLAKTVRLTALQWLLLAVQRAAASTNVRTSAVPTNIHGRTDQLPRDH